MRKTKIQTSSLSSTCVFISSSEIEWCLLPCAWFIGGVGLGAALNLPLPGGEANFNGPETAKKITIIYLLLNNWIIIIYLLLNN